MGIWLRGKRWDVAEVVDLAEGQGIGGVGGWRLGKWGKDLGMFWLFGLGKGEKRSGRWGR